MTRPAELLPAIATTVHGQLSAERAKPATIDMDLDMETASAGLDASPRIDELSDRVQRAFDLLTADSAQASDLAASVLAACDPDSSLGGRAQHAHGMAQCLLGRIAEGLASLREATETLQRHGPALATCRAWRDYASVLALRVGDAPAGIKAFERALALAEALGDQAEQGAVLARLGPVLGRVGRNGDACQVLHRAVRLLENNPDTTFYATALSNLGYQLIQQEEYAQAVPHLRTEVALRDPLANRLHAANSKTNLAVALAGTGQATEAMALLESVAPLLDPEVDLFHWADYVMSAGTVSLLLGDAPAACAQLSRALQVAREGGVHMVELDTLVQLSRAHERCGDLAGALQCERELRQVERRWLDEQTASRAQTLQSSIELAEKRAENQALSRARAELEQRVEERTMQLQDEVRERDTAQRLARFWAEHDWLTRLPNRRQMQAALESHLARAVTNGTQLGVLFVDLDGFKAINDSHGHLAGDRLLRLTARRLRQQAPPGAIVTRFGGDEFVVLLPELAGAEQATACAQSMRAALAGSLKLDGWVVSLSCSVGVAIGPRDATRADELLRCADRAMLQAKADGRNQVRELDAGGQHRLERRGRLRRELGDAIQNNRFTAVFQPLWSLRQRCLAGVELLARWHDPELGWVSPADFIPVAEESGQIGALGLWAVREAVRAALALRAAGQWRDDAPGQPGMRISVNVSTVQLADPQLLARLVDVVAQAGGQTSWLELELTESVQLAEDPACQLRLRHLREAGFTLAIDDFGAGYSSFSYLSRAYFDRLKIDRALVQAAIEAADRSAVTGSIILMAHRLGLQVVAEGIETEQQIELLAAQDCDLVQGYHIARPMPLSDLLAWQPKLA